MVALFFQIGAMPADTQSINVTCTSAAMRMNNVVRLHTMILWKEAQQEVQQHWLISNYIAAYIQVLYRVDRVHPTGLTINQGWSQLSTGLPLTSGLCWNEKMSDV
jgi:hypothetical protein